MADGSSAKRAKTFPIMDSGAAAYDYLLVKAMEEHARTNPAYALALAARRRHFKEYCESNKKLEDIHAHILEKEALFVEEKKKWLAKNRHLRSDMNQFFVERCQWEIQFKETFLKPFYEERRLAARGISSFWSLAMLSDRLVAEQITDKDGHALEYLNDIKSSRTANLKGFELKFIFDDNPFFKNKVLTIKYEVTGDNDSVSLKAIGTKIDWNPSHTLTEKRSKSFFNFFKSYATVDPLSFDIEVDELKGDLPEDYEIGTKIRGKIIPHAISRLASLPTEKDDDDSGDGDSDDGVLF